MPRTTRTSALASLLLLAGCGPQPEQLHGAVLLYAPLIYAAGVVVVAYLWDARRRGEAEHGFGDRGHLVNLLVLVALAAWAARRAELGLFWPVVWLVGSMHLALWMIGWRALVGRAGPAAAWIAGAAASLVTFGPAIVGLVAPDLPLFQYLLPVWIWAGLFGLLPAVVFVVLALEGRARAGSAGRDEA